MMNSTYHIPVLLHESIEALNIKPDGVYVDCTFGGGGHSAHILNNLNEKGKLYAFDQDEDAQKNALADRRFSLIPYNFKYIGKFLKINGVSQVDGILADLGVSSHQFDEADKGFSTRFNGPLDMRMDQTEELTAFKIVKTYTAQQLQYMFQEYGEVTNAKTLSQVIVQNRSAMPYETTFQFKHLIAQAVKGNPNKYFSQVFQALRMEVNKEIESLKEMLQQTTSLLKTGGRLAVITFHSIEDRVVKQFMKHEQVDDQQHENPFETKQQVKHFKLITKKPIEANPTEVKQNKRSRSAKLRVIEKI